MQYYKTFFYILYQNYTLFTKKLKLRGYRYCTYYNQSVFMSWKCKCCVLFRWKWYLQKQQVTI